MKKQATSKFGQELICSGGCIVTRTGDISPLSCGYRVVQELVRLLMETSTKLDPLTFT